MTADAAEPGPLLVTGGAGFIGSCFVRRAVAAGRRVVTLDALTYAGTLTRLPGLDATGLHRFVRGDIRDGALLADLFRAERPAAVVHFAAESHVDRSLEDAAPFIQTNVAGTGTLLSAALAHRDSLPEAEAAAFRFLHVSTDEVFGSLGPEGRFDEATPYDPRSPYSASKAASDHLVRAFHHTYGLAALIVNCSNNYGPYHFPEKLIPLTIVRALAGKELPVYGTGTNVRDWVHVEDSCAAFSLVLGSGRPGETYCVGGESERTNLQVVEGICAALDREAPRADGKPYASQVAFVADRPGHDFRYAIDCGKLRRELGWAGGRTFEEGLAQTVRWYLDNRSWWEPIVAGVYDTGRLGLKPKAVRPALVP